MGWELAFANSLAWGQQRQHSWNHACGPAALSGTITAVPDDAKPSRALHDWSFAQGGGDRYHCRCAEPTFPPRYLVLQTEQVARPPKGEQSI